MQLELFHYNLARLAAAVLSLPVDVFSTPPMVEPPARTLKERQVRQQVQQLIESSWPTVKYSHAELVDGPITPNPLTYGEVTILGARQLFYYMDFDEDSVFFDMGMGNGKLVLQAYLECSIPVVGIELEESRYQQAVEACGKLGCSDDVTLLQGDLFQLDLSTATHIYVSSLCFTDSMMERLANVVSNAPNLKMVATLKELPNLRCDKAEYIEMSWTKATGSKVFFYLF